MPTYEPAEVVMLCLDAAKHRSGSSLITPSPIMKGGINILHMCDVTTQQDRQRCVAHLFQTSLARDLPAIVYAEEWTPMKKSTYATILGMGEGWGWWTAEINHSIYAARKFMPPPPVLRVVPDDWRDALFGKRRPRERAPLKKMAQEYVRSVLGRTVSEDVAESLCIGLYGIRDSRLTEEVRVWNKRLQRLRKAEETELREPS